MTVFFSNVMLIGVGAQESSKRRYENDTKFLLFISIYSHIVMGRLGLLSIL